MILLICEESAADFVIDIVYQCRRHFTLWIWRLILRRTSKNLANDVFIVKFLTIKEKKHKIYKIFYLVLQKLQIKVGINSIN